MVEDRPRDDEERPQAADPPAAPSSDDAPADAPATEDAPSSSDPEPTAPQPDTPASSEEVTNADQPVTGPAAEETPEAALPTAEAAPEATPASEVPETPPAEEPAVIAPVAPPPSETPPQPTEAVPPPPPPARRRLMRSRDHRVLGGVAGGVAERLDSDPGLIRVLFVILTLITGGIVGLVYIALWIITPLEPPNGYGAAVAAPATEEERRRQAGDRRIGTLVFGLLLVLAGAAWLLEATDAAEVDWSVVLAIAVIGLGALLVLTLGSVARGALITLGVLLTIALAFVSLIDINFESSFGDRREEPATTADLEEEYSHAFGSMTLDFRSLDLPEGTTEVKASTSFGSLEILLPPDLPVRVEAETNFGSVNALGQEANGLQADRVVRTSDYDAATRRIKLEVTASFGSVEIRR